MFQFKRRLEFPLVMKALAWRFDKGKFDSPSYSDFYWDKEGLTSAACSTCKDDLPGLECSCGLYATFRWDVVRGYTHNSSISPIILFEVSGKTQFYEEGVRAKQLAPFAVILEQGVTEILHMAGLQAADYFDVPTIPKSTAITVMDLWNITWFVAHQGAPYEIPYWREWYRPEGGDTISNLSDEWIEYMVKQLTGGEICSKSNTNMSTCIPQGA